MLYGGLWQWQWWSINEYSMASDNAVAEVDHEYSSYLIGISHCTSSGNFDISILQKNTTVIAYYGYKTH